MEHKMKSIRIFLPLLGIILLILLACEGDTGPMGPAGEKGDQGDQGIPGPGDRIVYRNTTPIPANYWEVNIPEITLDDMPSVSVYVALEDYETIWWELPSYFENYPDFGMMCFFAEGKVCFDQCRHFYYKIVIVI
jgi:hypothetical protein